MVRGGVRWRRRAVRSPEATGGRGAGSRGGGHRPVLVVPAPSDPPVDGGARRHGL